MFVLWFKSIMDGFIWTNSEPFTEVRVWVVSEKCELVPALTGDVSKLNLGFDFTTWWLDVSLVGIKALPEKVLRGWLFHPD